MHKILNLECKTKVSHSICSMLPKGSNLKVSNTGVWQCSGRISTSEIILPLQQAYQCTFHMQLHEMFHNISTTLSGQVFLPQITSWIRSCLVKMQLSLKTDVLNKVFSAENAFFNSMREQLGALTGATSKEREMIQHKVPLPNNFRNFIISLENICPEFLDRHEGEKGQRGLMLKLLSQQRLRTAILL